jgi:predicted RNase H-like HicB family nuclease
MQTLTAIIHPTPDGKWLVASNPETGATTQGRTLDSALANLKEATELYLSEFPLATNGRVVMTTFEVAAAHAQWMNRRNPCPKPTQAGSKSCNRQPGFRG